MPLVKKMWREDLTEEEKIEAEKKLLNFLSELKRK